VNAAVETLKQLDYLGRVLKAPRIRQAALRLADQERSDGWSHEEYLAAVVEQEVATREASVGDMRIRSAGFPLRKTIEDFSFDGQPGLRRDSIAHLSSGSYLTTAENIVLLVTPGTGKPLFRSAWESQPRRPATGCYSPPRSTGSRDCKPRICRAGSVSNSPGCAVTD
jgi:DNA replication protein DnaC